MLILPTALIIYTAIMLAAWKLAKPKQKIHKPRTYSSDVNRKLQPDYEIIQTIN